MVGSNCPQCVMQREQEDEFQAQLAVETAIETSAMMGGAIQPEEIIQSSPPAPPMQLGPLPPEAEIPLLVEAREGDVKAKVRDPRDVFLPAGCTSLLSANRICIRELVEVPDVRRRFPDFAPYISADSMVSSDRATKYRSSETSTGVEELTDHVFVYEFHEKPTEEYPKGRVIFMVNDIIVKEMSSPYHKLGRFPVYHFGFDAVKGEFYCDSYISQAWHRQKTLNRLETQLTEHVDYVLKPKLMNPQGTRIAADEFTADSAQVVTYNAMAGKPEWMQVPDLAMGVWNRKQDIMADVRMMASVTESEQGIMGTDPNGRAAAIINAEADQQVGPIVQRNNAEWRELHRGIIILYRCYAHPDRIATVAGPEGLESHSFGDLNLLQEGWDIQMEAEDGLSRNPAVRLTQALQLAQIGFFNDPMTMMFDRQGFARYAKLKTPDAGYDLQATERAAASAIPYLLEQGMPWQPRMFDDPMIFQEVLVAWLRGPGRKVDPMLSMQVEQIWMYYMQWAMTGMMPQPQAEGGEPGSGGSAPGDTMSAPGGSVGDGSIVSDASMQVGAADATGENAARQSLAHEG